MTNKEATDIVVQMAIARHEDTREGEALRVVLRELKEQRRVAIETSATVDRLTMILDTAEAKAKQMAIFHE